MPPKKKKLPTSNQKAGKTPISPKSPECEILPPSKQTSLSEALKEEMQRNAGPIARRIASIAADAELDRDAIAAANLAADRTEGKAISRQVRTLTMDDSTARALLSIGQSLARYMPQLAENNDEKVPD